MSETRQTNKIAIGGNYFKWDQMEALPVIVRDVINFAPVTLGTDRAWRAMLDGASPEYLAMREINVARRAIRELTLATYGPEHPQAVTSDPA